MKVLIEGKKPAPEWPKKFKCKYCESILEVESEDLKYVGSQYNESFYEYKCPICQKIRTVGSEDFKEITDT